MITKIVQNRLLQTTALVAFIGIQAVGISSASATDLPDVTTAVTTQNGGGTLNGNDSLTITTSGSIDTTSGGNAAHGVAATGGSNTITNDGTINVDDQGSVGVTVKGSGNVIANTGTITTDGTFGVGISADGVGTVNSVITNSGTITTKGTDSDGISAYTGGTITNSGKIVTQGNHRLNGAVVYGSVGIGAAGNNVTVTNSGSISTEGTRGDGILAWNNIGGPITGTNITNTASGTITTTAERARGIHVISGASGINTVTNSGTIITKGLRGYGIFAEGNGTTVVTSGLITVSGEDSLAIYAYGDGNSITNIGTIKATGIGGFGISAYGNNNTITNSGSITTTGSESAGNYKAFGLDVTGTGNKVVNSGSIFTTGNAAVGIYAKNGNEITNSGYVVSTQVDSFKFGGAGNTLNLNAPSFIGGTMLDLGTTTTLNIKTGPSHSIAWAFDPTDLVGGAPTISGSVPVFQGTVGGNLVVTTFDPTSLATGTDGLAGMVGLISGVTQGRLSNGRAGSNALGYAANSTSVIDETFAEVESVNQGWVQIVGSFAEYDGGSSTLDSEQSQAALVAGYDWSLSNDTIFGILAGYSQGKLKSDSKFVTAVDNTTKGFFAGFFGRTEFDDAFLSFGLTAGASNHDDDRFVNDNLAPLGVAHALGDYSSTWMNPEIAYGIYYDLSGGWVAAPTVRLSYAGQWMDGYTETGTSANATVGDRQIGVAELAFEWSATQKTETSMITARLGYAYRASVGDSTTDVTLVGVTKAVSNDNQNRHVAYVGGDALFALSEAIDLEFGAQVEFSEDHIGGNGSIKLISKF